MGFPGGSVVKNPPASAGDERRGFDPWVEKIPWSRRWHPTPVFLPGSVLGGGHTDTERETEVRGQEGLA